MERIRTLILTAGIAAILAVAPGCIHVTVDGEGAVKSVSATLPTQADLSASAKTNTKADPQVKQASHVKQSSASFAMPKLPSLPKFSTTDWSGPGKPATSIVPLWQNRIAHLQDPARGGAMGAGLVGQLFLYDQTYQFAPVTGTGSITIELFDEGVKGGNGEPVKLGQWKFDKDTLARLVTTDEHFGKCYAVFLPWPSYKPEITHIRLVVRHEASEGAMPLYALPSSVTINTTQPTGTSTPQPVWSPVSPAGFSGPGNGPGSVVPAGGVPPTGTPMNVVPAGGVPTGAMPIPVGGVMPAGFAAPSQPAMPAGPLSPIAITAPRR